MLGFFVFFWVSFCRAESLVPLAAVPASAIEAFQAEAASEILLYEPFDSARTTGWALVIQNRVVGVRLQDAQDPEAFLLVVAPAFCRHQSVASLLGDLGRVARVRVRFAEGDACLESELSLALQKQGYFKAHQIFQDVPSVRASDGSLRLNLGWKELHAYWAYPASCQAQVVAESMPPLVSDADTWPDRME